MNVSSVASFLYSAGNVNYCATKAYLTTFSEGLAAELAGTGVKVQALCPASPGRSFTSGWRRTSASSRCMWLSAADVVETSLPEPRAGGPVVCIPGLRYKVMVFLLRYLPRRLLRLLSPSGPPGYEPGPSRPNFRR